MKWVRRIEGTTSSWIEGLRAVGGKEKGEFLPKIAYALNLGLRTRPEFPIEKEGFTILGF